MVSADIYISQVLYDPLDESDEALELYNPSNNSFNLSGCIIKTESSDIDATLPDFNLQPKQYFLIKDKAPADHVESLTLSNKDAGVALICNNEIIDVVGWGNKDNIDDDLYLGTPAKHVKEGFSLLRKDYTDNNSKDFISSIPYFSNSSSSQLFLFFNTISNEYVIEDDSIDEGIQLNIIPGKTRYFLVNSTKSFNAKFLNSTFESVNNKAMIALPYTTSPNNYTLTINNKDHNIEVLPKTSLILDTRLIQFTQEKGSTYIKQGDTNIDSLKPTVKNIGNTYLDLILETSKILSSSTNIPSSNLLLSVGNTSLVLGENNLNIPPGTSLPLNIELTIPDETPSENFQTSIKLKPK